MSAITPQRGRVVALSGGIGGAKLALGLAHVMPPELLTMVANTADDFEHLGLAISPDIDTLMYTLAGLDNPATGWGRRDETWTFMRALEQLGGETWFKLGDADLAVHVERTRRLAAGERLSQITADFCRRLGVGPRILPMSDDKVRTCLETDAGTLDFQDYFVFRRCSPAVRAITFAGAEAAAPHPDFVAALTAADVRAIVVCPSNPLISIEPMLALAGVRDALRSSPAPVVAVSPIIGGRAVKGPTAKMMRELGLEVSAAGVSQRYAGLIDGFIAEPEDAAAVQRAAPGIAVHAARTLMSSLADRAVLAQVVLDVADRLRAGAQTGKA